MTRTPGGTELGSVPWRPQPGHGGRAIARRNTNLRIPTVAEYEAFDGAHCRNLYRSLAADWSCPGCNRSRYQLMRWTVLFPKSPAPRPGWAAGFHTQHDHGADSTRYGRPGPHRTPRFADVVICEQCNSADGGAKRKLGLPKDFSFSPCELRQFVTATPNGYHEVDHPRAWAIFQALDLSS